MRDFFSLEGPFYKYGGMIADMMVLSLLWILFSLPLFTVGASTAALFYVTTRRIAEREGYVTQDFWAAFKVNFKRATIVWLLLLTVILLLVFNLFNNDLVGDLAPYLTPVWIIFLAEAALLSVFVFPLAARFDMGVKELIKSALFMGNRHLPTSVTCLLLGAAIALGIVLYPLLALVAMGVYAWLASYLIIRVFKKYRPEIDKDPRLEIAEIEMAKKMKTEAKEE